MWCAKTQSFSHEMKCFGWQLFFTLDRSIMSLSIRFFFGYFAQYLLPTMSAQRVQTSKKKIWCLQKWRKKTVVVVVLFTSFSVSRESNQMESNWIESTRLGSDAIDLIAFNCSLYSQRGFDNVFSIVLFCHCLFSFEFFFFFLFHFFCIELLFRLNYFYYLFHTGDRLRLIDAKFMLAIVDVLFFIIFIQWHSNGSDQFKFNTYISIQLHFHLYWLLC